MNRSHFYFFLSNQGALYFCILAVARSCSTTLISSGDSRHPCSLPDLRKKILSFHHEYDASRRFSVDKIYQVEQVPIYSQVTENFYHEWMFDFVKCVLCICGDVHSVFILQFVSMVDHINFQMLSQPCIPRINPTSSWYVIIIIFYIMLD